MKAYTFETYRDKGGTGSQIYALDLDNLLNEAKADWHRLSESDKDSYRKDVCGAFRVYEMELTAEEWQELNDPEGELVASEFESREIWDALEG